ncbi:GNAT family N-acetyltransferase [Nocardioides zeae]|uniref:GNAT family N-acetyltransferase n=1 Tax=Nocardioides zeae TaxID=1457234 RepID=A0A6P0HNU2_9ACTN|nr:N-acetyltransferase [Nocardioides zeae]NEN80362.1 GNAT family N-acetyltransferase [Nocardioides zeae]
MTASIREPGPDDAEALADLHVATWRETYGHLLPPGFLSAAYVEGRRRMWVQVLGRPRDDVVVRVAEGSSGLVGFSWAGPPLEALPDGGRSRQLYALYVRAAHHGTGVGQRLLDEALGAEPAVLRVVRDNPRAVAFYRRNGFVRDGLEEVDPATPAMVEVRMRRPPGI